MGVSVGTLIFATFFQGRDILQGSKVAIPTGWLIWAAVNVVSFTAQQDAGSTDIELLIPGIQLFSTLALFFVTAAAILWRGAWQHKQDRHIDWGDTLAIACCFVGIVGWLIWQDPLVAIWGNVAANLAGLWPMLARAWRHPAKVIPAYWGLRGISTIFATGVFLTNDFHLAGFIPQVTGLVIAGSMLLVYTMRLRKRRPTIVPELSY